MFGCAFDFIILLGPYFYYCMYIIYLLVDNNYNMRVIGADYVGLGCGSFSVLYACTTWVSVVKVALIANLDLNIPTQPIILVNHPKGDIKIVFFCVFWLYSISSHISHHHNSSQKLFQLENIPGYPTNICIKCKNISETICNFISKFEETCSKLDSQIPKVKTEYIEIMSGIYNDEESAAYELQIDNIVLVKPKVEIKDPTELLEPLKHLTVKRIKLQNDASETAKSSVDDKDVKRKKAKPRKTVAQNSAKNNKPEKKAASKLTTVKKTIARPAGAAKKNGVTKTATNSKTAIDFKNEKIQR